MKSICRGDTPMALCSRYFLLVSAKVRSRIAWLKKYRKQEKILYLRYCVIESVKHFEHLNINVLQSIYSVH